MVVAANREKPDALMLGISLGGVGREGVKPVLACHRAVTR
jgi:hypothetical protein